MKTALWKKLSLIFSGVWLAFWCASLVLFRIACENRDLAMDRLAGWLCLGWAINFTPFAAMIVGLVCSLRERNLPGAKRLLRLQWLWFVLGLFLWTALLFTGFILAVQYSDH